MDHAQLGRIAPRDRGGVLEIRATSLREAKRRSNPLFLSLRGEMDCFASLAMTDSVPRALAV
jgi:hypothetical protein